MLDVLVFQELLHGVHVGARREQPSAFVDVAGSLLRDFRRQSADAVEELFQGGAGHGEDSRSDSLSSPRVSIGP